MSKTMEGMADAAWSADDPSVSGKLRNLPATEALEVRRMKAALLWLASNVSDEMVHHLIGELFKHRPPAFKFEYTSDQTREAISAALRAAAGGGDK